MSIYQKFKTIKKFYRYKHSILIYCDHIIKQNYHLINHLILKYIKVLNKKDIYTKLIFH